MLFWIIVAIGLAIVLYKSYRVGRYGLFSYSNSGRYSNIQWGDAIFSFVFGLIIIIAVLLVLCLPIYFIPGSHFELTHTQNERAVTLADSQGQYGYGSGNFLFYTQYNNANLTINWYSENDDGVFEPETASEGRGDTIRIHEVSKDETAYVIRRDYDEVNSPIWGLYPWDINEDAGSIFDIWVPKGTITQGNFRLDAR